MLFTKIKPQNFLGSGEDFLVFFCLFVSCSYSSDLSYINENDCLEPCYLVPYYHIYRITEFVL